ncbi:hypothetical protein C8R43DRAFT_1050583 [Mycena crocata]|nr:hypothetical protein C8R43DRAFT_1050583 [Mycena crocata]
MLRASLVGKIPSIIEVLLHASVVEQSVDLVVALACYEPVRIAMIKEQITIQYLCRMLSYGDHALNRAAITMLAALARDDEIRTQIAKVLTREIFAMMVDSVVGEESVRELIVSLARDADVRVALLQLDTIEQIGQMLTHQHPPVRQTALSLISTLAEDEQFRAQMITPVTLAHMVQLLVKDIPTTVREEALATLVTLARHSNISNTLITH